MVLRAAIAVALLLALLVPAPPKLLADGAGLLTDDPGVPNAPGGGKLAPSPASGPVHVMIELTDEPAVVAAAQAGRPGVLSVGTARTQAARVDRAQQALLQTLRGGGVNARVLYRVHRAYNGIAAIVDASAVDRIRAQPGVKAVRPIQLLKRLNSSTVPLVNAPAVWNGLGNTGQGVKIGIIDTGIDYIHKNFGGSGNYAANTSTTAIGDSPDFPGPVVVGGYDFAGDGYDADSTDPAKSVPSPDPDPIDCTTAQGGGHGSHVAGSAAGRGVMADNTTFAGPYDASVPFSSLKIGPGMAPGATLYALKVFGCDGTTSLVAQALDWALDPNGDDDFSDRLDIVNMSLGSDFGPADDPSAVAADNAALAGMIVVVAAGNAGDATGVAGSPASSPRAISVAASDDSTAILDGFAVTAPGSIAQQYAAGASVDFDWGAMPGPVSATLVYPSANRSGCSVFSVADAAAIKDQVVLLDWIPSGSTSSPCGSAARVGNAATASARGVILVYNQANLDISIAGAASIPSVIANSTTGALLKTNIAAPVQVTLDKQYLHSQRVVDATQVDRIGSFTSRGPSLRTAALKPDLAAPGVSVFSTASGTGTEGWSLSGTSMATPHVTGLMALLREQHPTWTVEELKALAMNTANHALFTGPSQSGSTYETSRVGAGRVDAATASASSLVAYETDAPGGVSVSFGAVESLGSTTQIRTVRVVNKGASAAQVTAGYTPISQVAGASISFPDGTNLTVGADSSQTFRVQLTLDGSQLKNPRDPTMDATQANNPRQYLAELTGLVTVAPTSGPSLRVPLYAAVRPASDMHASKSTLVMTSASQTAPLGLAGTGVDNGASPPVDVRSKVSLFELQAVSPARPPDASPEQRGGDLRYVGVSSDGRVRGTVASSKLYFGLATELNWLRPTQEVKFSVLIDTNRDGTFDYELFNSHLVDGSGDPTDVMVTGLRNVSTDTSTVATFLNMVSSSTPTAIFDTNVQVLSVSVQSLGLTLNSPRFDYKVNVYYDGVVQDATGTLSYDWLHPGADVFTAAGQIPMLNDLPGNSATVTYSQASYQQNGSLGLLLLHHYNRDGQRAEVVTIGQSQTVSFATGSPTAKTLGDAPFAVSATASSGLAVTIGSQTPAVCTIDGSNLVTLVAADTCTLRASQAGTALFLPASADLTIAVAPNPCQPRSRVALSTTRLPDGRLQVVVTAGHGALQSIRFGTPTRGLVNGSVGIDVGNGPRQVTTGTTLTLPANTTSQTFTVTRTTAGQPTTIPMIVTDGCGAWETFVGIGAGG